MSKTKREELQAIVEKGDSKALINFIQNGKSQMENICEILSELSHRSLVELWDGLRNMCTLQLLHTATDCESDEADKLVKGILGMVDSVVTLARATIEQPEVILPQSLIDMAIILHGILPTLSDQEDYVKHRLAQLFEKWWYQELESKEDIIPNAFIYLLERSLHPKGTVSDVKAVCRLHTVLQFIDFISPNSAGLKNLLGRCCSSFQYLKSDEGRRFLGFAFTLNTSLVEYLHKAIKNQIPFAPKSWLPLYGEVYFRGWQKSTGEIQEKIETDCIQDLMLHGINCYRIGSKAMFSKLFRVLNYFHRQKKQRGVDDMLLKLYGPILWRSLNVPNAETRANSITLLLDVFPLQNSDSTAEEMDSLMQKQLDVMQSSLRDPCPLIRAIVAEGVCRVMGEYLEMIPMEVVQTFLKCLLQELAWDTTSHNVRVAVIKGITTMLDNPMCHLLLKPLLPCLKVQIHDVSESVRLAMMQLLLKVKCIKSIKYWNITPIEHLLARLDMDSPPMIRRIVELVFPSFLPLDKAPEEQISRCLTLLETNPSAARIFFLNAPRKMTITDTVNYISLLCRYILLNIRAVNEQLNSSTASTSSKARVKQKNTPGKKTKEDLSQLSHHDSTECEENDGDDDEIEELTPGILQGLLETIYIMWSAIAKDIKNNEDLKQSIMKKISVTVPEILKTTQDAKVMSILVQLAGLLPPNAVPSISHGCLSRLKKMPQDCGPSDYAELIEASIQWGKASDIVHILIDWLEVRLTSRGKEPDIKEKGPRGKKCVQISVPVEEKKPELALEYLTILVQSTLCRRILLGNHRPDLVLLNRQLSGIMPVIERYMQDDTCTNGQEDTSDFAKKVFSLHLRLTVMLHGLGNADTNCVACMKDILTWQQQILFPVLSLEDDNNRDVDETCRRNINTLVVAKKRRQEIATEYIMVTLEVLSNMLMCGIGDQTLAQQLLEFCQVLLETATVTLPMICGILNCLEQMVLFKELDVDALVAKFIAQVLAAVQTCFQHLENEDSKHIADVKSKLSDVVISILTRARQTDEDPVILELTSSMLASVLAEMQHASKKDLLPECVDKGQELLPVVSTWILKIFSRTPVCRRLFVKELTNFVELGTVTDPYVIHAACHLLYTISKTRTYSKDVDMTECHTSVCKLVNWLDQQSLDKVAMDPDLFKDLLAQMKAKLQLLV